jgi:hypothetical protein
MDYVVYFVGLVIACGFLLGFAIWWQLVQIKLLLKERLPQPSGLSTPKNTQRGDIGQKAGPPLRRSYFLG